MSPQHPPGGQALRAAGHVAVVVSHPAAAVCHPVPQEVLVDLDASWAAADDPKGAASVWDGQTKTPSNLSASVQVSAEGQGQGQCQGQGPCQGQGQGKVVRTAFILYSPPSRPPAVLLSTDLAPPSIRSCRHRLRGVGVDDQSR